MEAADWKSAQGLRGNYQDMGLDWTVPQVSESYRAADHDVWRKLCARQSLLVHRHATPEFLATLGALDFGDRIPRFDDISELLRKRSGWEIVGVPGFLPDDIFFGHLAERRFPVTVWIRTPEEFDYIVEPDIFHDLFGHVPLLADRCSQISCISTGRAHGRRRRSAALRCSRASTGTRSSSG